VEQHRSPAHVNHLLHTKKRCQDVTAALISTKLKVSEAPNQPGRFSLRRSRVDADHLIRSRDPDLFSANIERGAVEMMQAVALVLAGVLMQIAMAMA
jgi:hypothetical protein